MEFLINNENASEITKAFIEKAESVDANLATIMHAALTLFMTSLSAITKPDPATGKKTERIVTMIPGIIDAWIKDSPTALED